MNGYGEGQHYLVNYDQVLYLERRSPTMMIVHFIGGQVLQVNGETSVSSIWNSAPRVAVCEPGAEPVAGRG